MIIFKRLLALSFFILLFFNFPKNIFSFYPVLGIQDQQYAAYDSNNDRFLVVWSDCRNTIDGCQYGKNDKHDIYGQIIGGDANCFGGNFPIFLNSNRGAQFPAAAFNPYKNEYLVVFQAHKRNLQGNEDFWQNEGYDIVGQRVSSRGELIGSEFFISNIPGNDNDDQQWHPRVAFSAKDQAYMIVWHDGRVRRVFSDLYSLDENDRTTFKDIYGQIVKSNGSLLGQNFPVTIDSANNTHQYFGFAKRIQQYADIAYDSKNERFIVVWEDDRSGVNPNPHPGDPPLYDRLNSDIWAGFFDGEGNSIGENFRISSTSDAERYARISFNPVFNEFLVTWQASQVTPRSGAYPGDWIKAYGQRFNLSGSPKADKFLIEPEAKIHDSYYDKSYPPNVQATVNPESGEYLLVWKKDGEIIYGKTLDPQNGAFGNRLNLSQNLTNYPMIFFRDNSSSQNYLLTGLKYGSSGYFVGFTTSGPEIFNNCQAAGGVSGLPVDNPPLPTPTPGDNGCTFDADINNDGQVNISDFNVWKSEFLSGAETNADINCDNKVSLADFEIWRSNASF